MLAWLNEWLKSIIIIILLAAFVDLILPNRSMQRYVKVVISLFVLMTILTPIVQFLVADFDWDKFEFPSNPIDSIVASVAPLEEIEREGELIRTETEQQAMAMVTDQVEQLMAEQLTEILGKPPYAIHVTIEQSETGEAELEQVNIELVRDEDLNSAQAGGGRSGDRVATDSSTGEAGTSGRELVRPEELGNSGVGSSELGEPGTVIGPDSDSTADDPLVESLTPVHVKPVDELGERSDRKRPALESERPTHHETVDHRKQRERILELLQREWKLAHDQVGIVYIAPE